MFGACNWGHQIITSRNQSYFDAIKQSPFQYHENADELAEVFFNPDHQGYLTKEGTIEKPCQMERAYVEMLQVESTKAGDDGGSSSLTTASTTSSHPLTKNHEALSHWSTWRYTTVQMQREMYWSILTYTSLNVRDCLCVCAYSMCLRSVWQRRFVGLPSRLARLCQMVVWWWDIMLTTAFKQTLYKRRRSGWREFVLLSLATPSWRGCRNAGRDSPTEMDLLASEHLNTAILTLPVWIFRSPHFKLPVHWREIL